MTAIRTARRAVAALACAFPFLLAGGALRAAPRADAPPAAPSPSPAVPTVPEPSKRAVFSSDVDVVAVDVNVVDKQGRPIRGLGLEDFTISVDGGPRRVISADFVSQATEEEAAPAPRTDPDRVVSTNEGIRRGRIIVIVVDQGNIRPGVGRHALRAADRLMDALNPQDQVALVTMPGGGPQVELTSEHGRVRDALKRIVGRAQYAGPRLSLAQALAMEDNRTIEVQDVLNRLCPPTLNEQERELCLSDVQGEAFSVAANFRHQSDVSMKGLGYLMQSLQQVEGPKTVVLITEGLHSERIDELRTVANAAASARVAFFGIHIDETGIADASRSEAPATVLEDSSITTSDLYRLATLTRGAVFGTVGSAAPFERIAREISGYYLVGFEPQGNDRDGKDHVVDVKVPRPGVTVRARRALPMGAPQLEQKDLLLATIRNPQVALELPLRVTAYSSRDAASGKVRVLVSAEVGKGGTPPAGLAVGFALVDDKGKVVGSSYQRVGDDVVATTDGPVSYLGSTSVDPGRYVLKLAAIDARGRRGSVEHPVRATLTTIGPFEVSDLVVAPPPRAPGQSLRPGVETAIDAGAALGIVDLHARDAGALKSATVSVELATDEVGPALVSAPARLSEPANGQRSAQGAVSLSLVPPGRYVARAVVSHGGTPMGQVTRPVVVAPSRAGAAPTPFPAAALPGLQFDRRALLAPQVVVEALDALAVTGPPSSPSVSRAADEARQGRLDKVADLLSAGVKPSADLAFLRGLGLYARGEMAAAADQFRASLRLRPDFGPATIYLGAASAAMGRDQDAVGAWNTAMLEESRSPVLSLLMGDALLRRGEVDSAIDLLKEAASAWPADERFRQRLGLAYLATGRPTEALPLLTAYADAHPADTDTLFAIVRLLYETRGAPGADRARLLRYARAYVAAAGPQQALVGQWIKSVESAPAR
jgi:VWFA-related protein